MTVEQSEFVFVYSTCPDLESAHNIGDTLVAQKLAACVNIYPPMTSIFEWDGKREAATEIALFIKTRRTLAEAAIAAARPLHPYSVPCFLVLTIETGNSDYLAWAREQTRTP
jgi:periplasmic divalent cation tolerance protein